MKKKFAFLQEEFGIDFFKDFILHDDRNFYFYLNLSNGNALDTPICPIQDNFLAGILPETKQLNFSFLLENLNTKSEKIELVGLEKFKVEMNKYINSKLEEKQEFVIPLFFSKSVFLETRLLYVAHKNIVLGSFRDCTKEQNLFEALYVKSYKDSLTGLFNRNTCLMHLDSLDKNATNIHVLMIDLNRFKDVNDFYGHDEGDRVLNEFGKNIMKIIDGKTIFYRLAGDEFICQAKDYTDKSIKELAIKINKAANDIKLPKMAMGASVGIIKYNGTMNTSNLLRIADRAMYKAKNSKKYCYAYPSESQIAKWEQKSFKIK